MGIIKGSVREILTVLISVQLSQNIILGFVIPAKLEVFLSVCAIIFLFEKITPIFLKIILAPLGFILGPFSVFIANIIALLFLSNFYNFVKFTGWHFSGFSIEFITLSARDFNSLETLVLTGVFLGFFSLVIDWICE